MEYFTNKLALITGGSSGIGLAIARQIVEQGGNVAILARRAEVLDQAVSELNQLKQFQNQLVLSIQADITQQAELDKTLTHFIDEYGLPDFVINSAGVAQPGIFSSQEFEIFHWMMDVNYFGTVNTLKTLVPLMKKRHSGAIVNISSIAGFIGVYGYTAYSASKFAVTGFTDALRSELLPYGIQVSIAFPPDTDTPQLKYESQFKPFITKQVAGSAKLESADSVALEIIKQMKKKKYIILPGSEGKMMYFARNFLGSKLYPVMDILVNSSIKKLKFGK